MLNHVQPGTAEHLVLGAGLFLRDFRFDAAQDAAALRSLVCAAAADDAHVLGATREGSRFSCVPRLRQLNAGGVRQPYVGGTLCDGWQVRMTGTLVEVTPANMAMLLAVADTRQHGRLTTVSVSSQPDIAAHLTNLCWVGRQGSGFVLIELLGALNMTGITLSISDQGEATAPFCFEAHALTPGDQTEAPFRVVFFEGGGAV